MSAKVEKYLNKNGIEIKNYDAIYDDLKEINTPTFLDYKSTS